MVEKIESNLPPHAEGLKSASPVVDNRVLSLPLDWGLCKAGSAQQTIMRSFHPPPFFFLTRSEGSYLVKEKKKEYFTAQEKVGLVNAL